MKYRLVWKYWSGTAGMHVYGHADFIAFSEANAAEQANRKVEELRESYTIAPDTEFVLYHVIDWVAA